MGGRSREELERIVRPRLRPARTPMRVHPPMHPCADQEEMLAALLSAKEPLSARALVSSVAAAVVAYNAVPFELRALLGKLCLHWLGWNGAECHAYMVLDALTCSGCDRHNQGIYVLLLRLLPVLRRTLAGTGSSQGCGSR